MNFSEPVTGADQLDISVFPPKIWLVPLRLLQRGTRLVLCSGGPLPGHADVPGSNPGRTPYSKHTLSD